MILTVWLNLQKIMNFHVIVHLFPRCQAFYLFIVDIWNWTHICLAKDSYFLSNSLFMRVTPHCASSGVLHAKRQALSVCWKKRAIQLYERAYLKKYKYESLTRLLQNLLSFTSSLCVFEYTFTEGGIFQVIFSSLLVALTQSQTVFSLAIFTWEAGNKAEIYQLCPTGIWEYQIFYIKIMQHFS